MEGKNVSYRVIKVITLDYSETKQEERRVKYFMLRITVQLFS